MSLVVDDWAQGCPARLVVAVDIQDQAQTLAAALTRKVVLGVQDVQLSDTESLLGVTKVRLCIFLILR